MLKENSKTHFNIAKFISHATYRFSSAANYFIFKLAKTHTHTYVIKAAFLIPVCMR